MRLLLASIIAGALAVAAPAVSRAAPPAPIAAPPNWTGFYVGGNVGFGWANPTANYSPNDPAAGLLLAGAAGLPFEQPVVTSYDIRQSGAVGGIEAGYNWQAGSNWLVGLEADFSFSDINGQAGPASFLLGPPFVPTLTQAITGHESTDWYGTARGRLGWLATPNLLIFGTGGLAYGRVTGSANYVYSGTGPILALGLHGGGFSFTCTINATCFSGTSSMERVGWTAGGGVEWLFDRHWSLKAEYQLVDLGSETVRIVANAVGVPGTSPSSFNAVFKDQIHTARLGVNYHF